MLLINIYYDLQNERKYFPEFNLADELEVHSSALKWAYPGIFGILKTLDPALTDDFIYPEYNENATNPEYIEFAGYLHIKQNEL